MAMKKYNKHSKGKGGGKKKKGKERIDKYYILAKEQGYRARSAFKLIQICQKFNILQNCNNLVDLCAAPGGWLQVVSKNLGINSKILGVDLCKIRKIPNVETLQCDIMSDGCIKAIRSFFNDEKVDVVLHDGSPNVGKSWIFDAYKQNELVVYALKIAASVLKYNGTFLTKVFRSSDYNSLLYILNELFMRVQATKPSSSRSVSAEIFLICTGFKYENKKGINDKFFDTKFVFVNTDKADGDASQGNTKDKKKMNLSNLLKTQKKVNRSGYEEGDDYRVLPVMDFFNSDFPANDLMNYNKIIFTDGLEASDIMADDSFVNKIVNNPLTTNEIRTLCDDLKVLGKSDFRNLILWRFKVKRYMAKCEKNTNLKNISVENGDKAEELISNDNNDVLSGTDGSESTFADGIDEEIENFAKNKALEQRRITRKERKKMQKIEYRKKYMNFDTEKSVRENDDELFHLNKESASTLIGGNEDTCGFDSETDEGEFTQDDDDLEVSNDSENDCFSEDDPSSSKYKRLEDEINIQYEIQKQKKQSESNKNVLKSKTRRQKVQEEKIIEMNQLNERLNELSQGELEKKECTSSEDDDTDSSPTDDIPLDDSISLNNYKAQRNEQKKRENEKEKILCDRWFSQNIFKNVGLSSSKKEKSQKFDSEKKEINEEIAKETCDSDISVISELPDELLPKIPLSDKKLRKLKSKNKNLNEIKPTEIKEKNEIEIVKIEDSDNISTLPPSHPQKTAEIQAIGSLLINRQSRCDLIDGAYNRYSFNDPELPEWFVEDEEKHYKVELPVSKELMRQYKKRLNEINSKPIRKVQEAVYRKKMRLRKKLDKIRQHASKLVDADSDLVGKENSTKMKNLVRTAYKSAGTKREKSYVVSRGVGKASLSRGKAKTSVRGKGASGGRSKIKYVDRRLKKDKRASKLRKKKNHVRRRG